MGEEDFILLDYREGGLYPVKLEKVRILPFRLERVRTLSCQIREGEDLSLSDGGGGFFIVRWRGRT